LKLETPSKESRMGYSTITPNFASTVNLGLLIGSIKTWNWSNQQKFHITTGLRCPQNNHKVLYADCW